MPRAAPLMPAKLAESAFELFSESGFEAVTIDEIAAHAGVTKGSFYSHYRSKQEVVHAACAHYYRGYQRRVHEALASLADPLERLTRVLELSVRTCVLDRGNRVFTTEIFARLLQDDEVRKGWAQFYDTVREMYVGLLMAVEAAGQLEIVDSRAAVDLMLAAMEGVKMRAAFEPRIGDAEEQRAVVAGLLGILSAPPFQPAPAPVSS
ncbi:MAG: TetR/AcrR family transcriptional regulator [Planctomycetes bacterium]|nr:TetR/AcrR family transcriptional regulator [Planctomycetota bacterium]